MKVRHKIIPSDPNNPNKVEDFLNEMMETAKRPINELVLGITYDNDWRCYDVYYLSDE